jgi:hypothetical protein
MLLAGDASVTRRGLFALIASAFCPKLRASPRQRPPRVDFGDPLDLVRWRIPKVVSHTLSADFRYGYVRREITFRSWIGYGFLPGQEMSVSPDPELGMPGGRFIVTRATHLPDGRVEVEAIEKAVR